MTKPNVGLGTKQLLSLQFWVWKPHSSPPSLLCFPQGTPLTCFSLSMNTTEQWYICINALGIWNKAIEVLSIITTWLPGLSITGPWKLEKDCASVEPFDFLNETALNYSGSLGVLHQMYSCREKNTIVFPIDHPHTHKRYTQKPADNLTRFLYSFKFLTLQLERFQ